MPHNTRARFALPALRAGRADLLPDRRKFRLIPDPDQYAAFDLKLVVRIGGDLLVAGRDVALGMLRPVEQRYNPAIRMSVEVNPWVFTRITTAPTTTR